MYLHVLTFPFHTLCSISHTSGQDHIFRGLFSRIPPIKPDRRSLSCLLPELPASLCLCPATASVHLLIFSELNSGFLVTLSSLQYLSHQSIFFFFFLFPSIYLLSCCHTILITSHSYSQVHIKTFCHPLVPTMLWGIRT